MILHSFNFTERSRDGFGGKPRNFTESMKVEIGKLAAISCSYFPTFIIMLTFQFVEQELQSCSPALRAHVSTLSSSHQTLNDLFGDNPYELTCQVALWGIARLEIFSRSGSVPESVISDFASTLDRFLQATDYLAEIEVETA